MRSTNRITTHIFQNTNLTTDSSIIHSTSQRTEVMMIEITATDVDQLQAIHNDLRATGRVHMVL